MALIDKLRAKRESWVELDEPPRRAVLIRRPAEVQILTLRQGKDALALAGENVHGWRGFTEADVIGAEVGSSDEIAFDREVWTELVSDSIEWTTKVANAVMDAVNAHLEARKTVSGN